MFPVWLKQKKTPLGASLRVNNLLKQSRLHTVCQSARCPNLGECFSKGTATFLILGNTCTRHCRFCAIPAIPHKYGTSPGSVSGGISTEDKETTPAAVDAAEPRRVAEACRKLNLKHIVVTSVTRDDLPDGGSGQFSKTIETVRSYCPDVTIEVLTPDFQGQPTHIRTVINAQPDIFNHNIETVKRLYPEVRPEADYQRSLDVLKYAKTIQQEITTKSGLMLGLGEEKDEVIETLRDLRNAGCDIVTLGQYLRPDNKKTLEVKRFVSPDEFDEYKTIGLKMGFKAVASGPLVRSSYNADAVFNHR
ncbi:MAG: lipoyl synthase [Planctomycetes bacterium]|nr:lipoyl synthase [Planctomycetota bacterium]